MITTIRQILEKKGFDLTEATLNWTYKRERQKLFTESIPYKKKYIKDLNDYFEDVLDKKFDDEIGHPVIKYFEAFNPEMEIAISFIKEPYETRAKMKIEVDFLIDSDEEDQFKMEGIFSGPKR